MAAAVIAAALGELVVVVVCLFVIGGALRYLWRLEREERAERAQEFLDRTRVRWWVKSEREVRGWWR